MELLTKDNLENMIDAGCIDEADRDEILKNQEIAKFLEGRESIMTYEKEAEEAKQIVERLKKYLKNIDADILDKEKVCLCDEYGCEDSVRKAVQKILGEKNENN